MDTSIVARHEIEQCAVRSCVGILKSLQEQYQECLRRSLSASLSNVQNLKIATIADCIGELEEAYGVKT